jgi:ABC-type cobalamin/Fe3+-siderophores transport system ATPase subunit
MEYDEGREITRLIAEEMQTVSSSFPHIQFEKINLLAALHLTKGLILQTQYRDIFEDARAAVTEVLGMKDFDDTEIRAAFNEKLLQIQTVGRGTMDREVRVKTATYLIDLFICHIYSIAPSHPLAVAAIVGSIHSTLYSPVVEIAPTTAELSIGRGRVSDDSSFPMVPPSYKALKNIISFKLIINQIYPYFIDGGIPDDIACITPSYLIDSGPQLNFTAVTGLTSLTEFALKHPQAARFILVLPSKIKYSKLLKEMSPALKAGLRLDAAICFSSSEAKNASSDKILLIFSQHIHMLPKPHLYVNVSNSNKSLERLDLQERAILAGHIFNIHEARDIKSLSRSIPSKVATILNAQFSSGYQNVKTLCIEHKADPREPLKIYSPKNFIRTNQLEGSAFNITANPQDILKLLSAPAEPACIYIIGNNGAGKTQLLCELIQRVGELNRKTVGISTGVHDRFPLGPTKQNSRFEYRGARTSADSISPSKLTKNITYLASRVLVDQNMLDALKECQKCLGFAPRFYFMLRPEMALDSTPTDIRLMKMSDDAADNNVPTKLTDYEFGVVRPETEEQKERIVSYSSLSSGEQNINHLLLSIITTADLGTVFLVDEPEISLHLKWQQTLPRVFHLLSLRFGCSFVVATHAPTLITNANDRGSHSFMLDMGRLPELSERERYSVESIILGGFGTYTPHNRAVHEACARIVAKTMESKGTRRSDAPSPLAELQVILDKMKTTHGAYVPPGQQEDIDLIKKAYTAVELLLRDQEAADKLTSEEVGL